MPFEGHARELRHAVRADALDQERRCRRDATSPSPPSSPGRASRISLHRRHRPARGSITPRPSTSDTTRSLEPSGAHRSSRRPWNPSSGGVPHASGLGVQVMWTLLGPSLIGVAYARRVPSGDHPRFDDDGSVRSQREPLPVVGSSLWMCPSSGWNAMTPFAGVEDTPAGIIVGRVRDGSARSAPTSKATATSTSRKGGISIGRRRVIVTGSHLSRNVHAGRCRCRAVRARRSVTYGGVRSPARSARSSWRCRSNRSVGITSGALLLQRGAGRARARPWPA